MITEDWNAELGMAQCIITDTSNNVTLRGYGRAICSEEDEKYASEITGRYIANCRARIEIMRQKRDYELKPAIMTLQHVISTMEHSNKYNPNSYEAKRIRKELKNLQNDLRITCSIINDEKESLKIYLEQKDAIYRKLDENN